MESRKKIEHIIYEDGVISVALFAKNKKAAESSLYNIQIKYLQPQSYRNKEDEIINTTNAMGGETDWFIVPYSFSVTVAKTLIEQKISGLSGFNEDGFEQMIKWLIELEEIQDAMCY